MKVKKIYLLPLIVLALSFASYSAIQSWKKHSKEVEAKEKKEYLGLVKAKFNHEVFNTSDWPKEISVDDKPLKIKYTFNEKLVSHIKRQLRRYRSDYSSVIVIDNESGKILAAIGHQRSGNKFSKALAFSSTHPSASLFKIVTSAELLENGGVDKDTVFNFRGRGTTLYRYQLMNKKNRWTRYMSFGKAFAFSNNVIFGKAAINNMTGPSLFDRAIGFGFNKDLMSDVELSKSKFVMPAGQYNLAELASGFNKETLISPVHAAVIASAVANNGIVKSPFLISSIVDSEEGQNIWERPSVERRAFSTNTSWQLKDLMELTVKRGTARGAFRRMRRSIKSKLDIGGKTGSITGGVPFGKRDWFAAYATPKNRVLGKGISIAVMNVNVKKWYIKSSYLAKNIIEYYYKNISPLKATTTVEVKTKQNKDKV
jgi:cell division protein FtsI/penicillin-binding protein 2